MGYMPAVGELVRCTSGGWMVFPPLRCQAGHRLRRNNVRVGHQPCGCGGHTTWACAECDSVEYSPPLANCQPLDGAAAVR